jgi:hypothetical protein
MAEESFISYSPQPRARLTIDRANEIIAEYDAQGFRLTIRQLFYQFVARGWVENSRNGYRHVGDKVGDGRDAGMIDWDMIEDHTREVHTHISWDGPAEIISDDAAQYQEDLWAGQPYRPEVWIEKDALIGVIERVCTKYRVPYFAMRGNNSRTLQHEAGKRFRRYVDEGLKPVLLLLTDHDPKGVVNLPRDTGRRLALYARAKIDELDVRRLALTWDQAQGLPPNFAKENDPDRRAYQQRFRTNKCWELDALSPTVIAGLIEAEIKPMIKQRAWARAKAQEQQGRKLLNAAAENWASIERSLIGPRPKVRPRS